MKDFRIAVGCTQIEVINTKTNEIHVCDLMKPIQEQINMVLGIISSCQATMKEFFEVLACMLGVMEKRGEKLPKFQ